MEPALELSGKQSTNLLEKMLLKGLDVEDLKRLVWTRTQTRGKFRTTRNSCRIRT